MKRKIIVNNKEFTMPKMSIDTYTEYLELAEVIDAKQRYSNSLMVGGEAGDEAILPLAEFYAKLNTILDRKIQTINQNINATSQKRGNT